MFTVQPIRYNSDDQRMGGDFVREADWIEAERVAIQVAKEAGAMARKRFGSRFVVEEKGNSGDLVTEVDEAADQLIVDRIRNCFPHPDQRAFWLDWIRQVRKGSGTGV